MSGQRAPASLRNRLTVTAGVVVALFLALAGFVLDGAFQASVERGVAEQLRLHAMALIGGVHFDAGRMTFPDGPPDERYTQPGAGLYGLIRDAEGHELWRSPSLSGLGIEPDWPRPAAGETSFAIMGGGSERLYRLSYGVIWVDDSDTELPMEFTVLAAVAPFREEVRGFRTSLYLGLGGLAVLLTLMQLVLLNWSLRPFLRLQAQVADVETGRAPLLSGDYPREIQPLVSHLNSFIRHERTSRERYRDALDDLAHALKTPLTALRSSLADGSRPGPDRDRLMRDQLQRMEDVIGHQLARALPASAPIGTERVRVRPLVERLTAALTKVYRDRGVSFDNAVPEQLAAPMDERDLMEVLGNLLDNACKYGGGRVRIDGFAGDDGAVTLRVADDGPGITSQAFDRLTRRGERGDQRGADASGQGIGLAVVRDVVERYGGELGVRASGWGGARIEVRLG